MRSLNLDPMFLPTSAPELKFKCFKFSGGEISFKLQEEYLDYSKIDRVVITHRVNSSDDLMKILMAVDALKLEGIKRFDLVMPYIPYARQDRKCDTGEAFSLKVFTKIINSVGFDSVVVLDSHSDVAPALIDNCENFDNHRYVMLAATHMMATSTIKKPLLVSPDTGANKKINKVFEKIKFFTDVVKCDKVRDVTTGNITGVEVFATDLDGQDCLIVDDICDGGRTFIEIAKELKRTNAGKVSLFVTHGIFSNGFDELEKHFTKIYTTNSFSDVVRTDLVKQFKISF